MIDPKLIDVEFEFDGLTYDAPEDQLLDRIWKPASRVVKELRTFPCS